MRIRGKRLRFWLTLPIGITLALVGCWATLMIELVDWAFTKLPDE